MLDAVEARTGELRAILDESPEALIAFGMDRKILHANVRAEAFFGYGTGHLTGLSTDALVPVSYTHLTRCASSR